MLQNTQFETPNPPSTTIRTNPHIIATWTQLFTTQSKISSNVSNIPMYNTVPPSTIPQSTVSGPTLINSSLSISEPIKPFVGINHNYPLEEYLHHIEACVTFHSVYNLCLITNINCGTLKEWFSYNALQLAQLSVGTSV